MSQEELTQEDKVNIFRSDLEESERLYAEGNSTEAYLMLRHTSKSFIKELSNTNK